MNSKLLKILAIGAMAMACVACDDDDKDISCENVTCESGTCDRGVCVTDAMKAVQAGAACDDTFVEFCNGDSMVYCAGNKVVIDDCANDGGCSIVKEKDGTKEVATAWCRGTDKCTDTTATEPYAAPYCVEEEYEGEKIALASAWYCVKNTEDSYTAIDMAITGIYDICDTTCNADKTACEKIHAEEGSTCDEATYADKCDGSIGLMCDDGIVYAEDCGEGYACVKSDDGLACAMPCTGNEEKSICEYDEFFGIAMSGKFICKDGYFTADEESVEYCNNDCNEDGTACKKYLDNEGEACVPGEYKEKCTNGIVDFCYEGETEGTGEITAFKCDEGYTCTVFESENYADCVSAAEECTTEGETTPGCIDDYFESYSFNYVCTKASNGKLYYLADATNATVCPNEGVCNENGTACAE